MINKALTADGLLFATNRDRALYLGTSVRDRPQWLKEHPDSWRPIEDVEQEAAALRRCAESDVEATPSEPSSPTLPSEVRSNSNGNGAAPPTPAEERLSAEEQPPAIAPQAIAASEAVPTTRDEINIGGRQFVSEQYVASRLGCSKRTLLRWVEKGIGPPRTKIGRRTFYDADKLQEWLANR